MSVYTRYKRKSDGLRKLVELLETTPAARRQKMIDVGMEEDSEYTERALSYMITFADILKLPDMELSELISECPTRLIAYAIYSASDEIKNRFLKQSRPRTASEIKEYLESTHVTPMQIGGGQLKLIEITRKLEKRGLIKTKRIPSG